MNSDRSLAENAGFRDGKKRLKAPRRSPLSGIWIHIIVRINVPWYRDAPKMGPKLRDPSCL